MVLRSVSERRVRHRAETRAVGFVQGKNLVEFFFGARLIWVPDDNVDLQRCPLSPDRNHGSTSAIAQHRRAMPLIVVPVPTAVPDGVGRVRKSGAHPNACGAGERPRQRDSNPRATCTATRVSIGRLRPLEPCLRGTLRGGCSPFIRQRGASACAVDLQLCQTDAHPQRTCRADGRARTGDAARRFAPLDADAFRGRIIDYRLGMERVRVRLSRCLRSIGCPRD